MKAVRGNKQYTIDETQKKFYQDGGFDIYDDEGKLVAYGKDKKVPYEEYAIVKEELEKLKHDGTPRAADADILEILADYASEHKIDLGNASSVSGVVKKIKSWKKEKVQNGTPEAGG